MLIQTNPTYRHQSFSADSLSEGLSLQDPLSGLDLDARPYQQRIVRKACQLFAGEHVDRFGQGEDAAGSVLIESPTGSGKTVMGLAIARYMQAVYGYRVGWVAMRRNLLQQAAQENHLRGFDIDMSAARPGDEHGKLALHDSPQSRTRIDRHTFSH